MGVYGPLIGALGVLATSRETAPQANVVMPSLVA